MSHALRLRPLTGAVLLTVALAACGQKEQAGGPPQMPPVTVGVVTAKTESVTRSTELPGRLEATRSAEVRARVPGIVLKRHFQQGSDVKQGQVLYEIDPSALRAALGVAQANLQQAEANVFQARQLERRYAPLVKARAVSQQEYDQAVAQRRLAEAQVAQMKAALDSAKLDLGYATVTAPISGRIGNALVTEGALVGQGEVTPLALIQQLDPIYVNFTQSASDVLGLQKAIASGELQNAQGETPVHLTLSNGEDYAHEGKLLSSGVSVDPGTGQITLRAEFPNPDRLLLPGMYVRGRVVQGVQDNAIQVPTQSVQRNSDGSAFVYIVDEKNQVQPRPVTTGSMQGATWIIDRGLNAGDRVVVDRFQQIRPGATVNPVAPGAAPSQGGAPGGAAPAGGAAGQGAAAAPAGGATAGDGAAAGQAAGSGQAANAQ